MSTSESCIPGASVLKTPQGQKYFVTPEEKYAPFIPFSKDPVRRTMEEYYHEIVNKKRDSNEEVNFIREALIPENQMFTDQNFPFLVAHLQGNFPRLYQEIQKRGFSTNECTKIPSDAEPLTETLQKEHQEYPLYLMAKKGQWYEIKGPGKPVVPVIFQLPGQREELPFPLHYNDLPLLAYLAYHGPSDKRAFQLWKRVYGAQEPHVPKWKDIWKQVCNDNGVVGNPSQ